MTTTRIMATWIEPVLDPFYRAARCVKGMAAVEFGLLIPILILFWLGTNEFGQALTLDRRVTLTASSIADLVAQNKSLTEAQIDDYLTSADALMQPALMSYYDQSAFKLVVVNIIKDDEDNLTVKWSRQKTATGGVEAAEFPEGQTVTAAQIAPNFDPAIIQDNSEQIVAIAEYDYSPTVGRIINEKFGGTIKLEETFFLAPRKGFVDLEP